MLNAKNCLVAIENADMDYISFGRGKKPLVMLPGLGEALQSVKGMALPFAVIYRVFAKDYTVYVFGRKRPIPEGYSIHDMAEDQAQAMRNLGIKGACVMGVSQGGMIAMQLTAAHPELVARLVLANTVAQCTIALEHVLENWIHLVGTDNYKGLLNDMGEKIYTEKRLKRYRP